MIKTLIEKENIYPIFDLYKQEMEISNIFTLMGVLLSNMHLITIHVNEKNEFDLLPHTQGKLYYTTQILT